MLHVNAARLAAGSSFSPADFGSDLKLWLDASDSGTVTQSGGAVSQWDDKSSNGYAFTQGSAGAKPTWGTRTQNGLYVMDFDGGDSIDCTSTAATWTFLHDGTTYIIAAVACRDTAGTNGTICNTAGGGGTNGLNFRFLAANTISHYVEKSTSIVLNSPSVGTSTAARVVSLVGDPDNGTAADRSDMYLDGGSSQKLSTATGATTGTDPTSALIVGNRSGGGLPLDGFVAELVIVVGSSATESNRSTLHDYLNTKWAVY